MVCCIILLACQNTARIRFKPHAVVRQGVPSMKAELPVLAGAIFKEDAP